MRHVVTLVIHLSLVIAIPGDHEACHYLCHMKTGLGRLTVLGTRIVFHASYGLYNFFWDTFIRTVFKFFDDGILWVWYLGMLIAYNVIVNAV